MAAVSMYYILHSLEDLGYTVKINTDNIDISTSIMQTPIVDRLPICATEYTTYCEKDGNIDSIDIVDRQNKINTLCAMKFWNLIDDPTHYCEYINSLSNEQYKIVRNNSSNVRIM